MSVTYDNQTATYVSNIIKKNEYITWTGKIVLLGAGTGKGKTYFVMKYVRSLKKQGMKHFLYICNRTALKNQIEKKYLNIVGLDAVNYQQLEFMINSGNTMDMYDKYDAFIMDECHYFLDDSTFNRYTDLVYWWLLKKQQHKTRIFMSATGSDIFAFIKKSVAELRESDSQYDDEVYELPEELQNQSMQTYDYARGLYWMHSKKDVIDILNELKDRTKKAIYFTDSLYKLKAVVEDRSLKIKKDECCFYYGNDSKQSVFAYNHKKVNSIEEFVNSTDKRFLFSTIALDNGVDIEDTQVRHIICNVFDFNGTIQCLGRKRVSEESDICNFYIMVPSKDELDDKYEDVQEKLEEIKNFNEDPNKWEIQDNTKPSGRTEKSSLIYYDPNNLDENGRPTRTINRLAEEKCRLVKENLELMLGINERHYIEPYQNILIQKAHIDPEKARDISELRVLKKRRIEKQEKRDAFLEKNCACDRFLTEDELKELAELCEIKTRGKTGIPQITKFNEYFVSCQLNYVMESVQKKLDGENRRGRMLKKAR